MPFSRENIVIITSLVAKSTTDTSVITTAMMKDFHALQMGPVRLIGGLEVKYVNGKKQTYALELTIAEYFLSFCIDAIGPQ